MKLLLATLTLSLLPLLADAAPQTNAIAEPLNWTASRITKT
jgi:hypothetical protein